MPLLAGCKLSFRERPAVGMMPGTQPWTELSDDVRLGVLTAWVTAEPVDEVLAEWGDGPEEWGASGPVHGPLTASVRVRRGSPRGAGRLRGELGLGALGHQDGFADWAAVAGRGFLLTIKPCTSLHVPLDRSDLEVGKAILVPLSALCVTAALDHPTQGAR